MRGDGCHCAPAKVRVPDDKASSFFRSLLVNTHGIWAFWPTRPETAENPFTHSIIAIWAADKEPLGRIDDTP